MPRFKGKLRKQTSIQCTTTENVTQGAEEGGSSGSEADLSSMDSFFDARTSPASRITETTEFVTSTSPLIRDPSAQRMPSPDAAGNPDEAKNWRSRLPAFLQQKSNSTERQQAPIITYQDSRQSSIELNEVRNGVNGRVRPRLTPVRSRSTDIQPVGSYFSDGVRLIDYVLVYDMDRLEDDELEETSDEEEQTINPFPGRTPAQQSAVDKRRIFETNLRIIGLELEYVYAKYNRFVFVLVHAPFKVLMKQAELLKIKMPVYQNDVKKVTNLMDGLVNGFLKRIPFIGFDQTVQDRIEPPDYFCSPFIEEHLDCFQGHEEPSTFFSRCQRTEMTYDILIRTRFTESTDKLRFGIERLIKSRTYLDSYPLHEDLEENKPYDPKTCSERRLLYENWVKPRNAWKYQPLHSIKNYFGTKIAFYFAWLGYYTRSLYLISFVGIACFLFGLFSVPYDVPSQQICNITGAGAILVCPICDTFCDFTLLKESCVYAQITYVFDNYATVLFAAITSIWATLFLEGWKRYHAELAYRWNVFDFEISNEDEVPRPEFQFRKKTRLDEITRTQQPFIPLREKIGRFSISGVSVLFAISVIIFLVVGIMVYRLIVVSLIYKHYYDQQDRNFNIVAIVFSSMSAAILNLIVIMALNQLYNRWALKLTEMEIPRTQSEFDNSYTIKVFAFQFVNFYSSLFYIAFVKPIWSIAENKTIFGYRLEECDSSGCMIELVIQLGIIMIGKQIINAVVENCYPIVFNFIRRLKLRPENDKERQERLRKESASAMEAQPESVSLVEKNFGLAPVCEQFLFDEYLEMAIQFGFCTLFVSAFPLAPFFALCNNILEIRSDAYKFINVSRKPIPHPARNIGIWSTILDLISQMSVLSNACVIAFTSDFIPRLYYQFHSEVGIKGYLERSLGYFDARHIQLKTTQHPHTTVCRYRGYRQAPCALQSLNSTMLGAFDPATCSHDPTNEYPYSNDFFYILVCRLLFVLIFEHLVLSIKACFAYLIPDIPAKIVTQLQRERYLARQAVLQRADENSTTINSTYRGSSQTEMSDTKAVAYQPGADVLSAQELEPSSALKRMYSNRKRPSLSSAHSSTNLHQAESTPNSPFVNDSSPNLSGLGPRFSVPAEMSLNESSNSFLTAPNTPIPKTASSSSK